MKLHDPSTQVDPRAPGTSGATFRVDDIEVHAGGALARGALEYQIHGTNEPEVAVLLVPLWLAVDPAEPVTTAFRDAGMPVHDGRIDLRGRPEAIDLAVRTHERYGARYAGVHPTRIGLRDTPGPGFGCERSTPFAPVTPFDQLPLLLRVPCTFDGEPVGPVHAIAAMRVGFAQYGLSGIEPFVSTLAPRRGPLSDHLEEHAPLGPNGFVVRDVFGVDADVALRVEGPRVTLVFEGIRVERRTRPRRDPTVRLLSRGVSPSDGTPHRVDHEFDHDPAEGLDEVDLVDVLRESLDPFVAAHAAHRLGTGGSEAAVDALLACLDDPAEDDTVQINAIWALCERARRDSEATWRARARDTLARLAAREGRVGQQAASAAPFFR
ncbi:MAG: HEAT repeat domain-containing protein [Alphaproteobacteria bacterium]|nr:HEAT repeat domain-containing protein [Alphaproteobacteria bacterium]